MTNDLIKFTAVIICFCIAATGGRNVLNKRDSRFLLTAMLLTVFADFFLLVVYIYPVGILFFCAVQTCYNVRFGGTRVIKVLLLTLILPVAFFAVHGDILVTFSLLYAQLFVLSYWRMLVALRKKTYPAPNNLLIFLGMTAFVLCDISVAIWNLGGMGIITNPSVVGFAGDAIWLFYAPSQVCLALSGRRFSAAP